VVAVAVVFVYSRVSYLRVSLEDEKEAIDLWTRVVREKHQQKLAVSQRDNNLTAKAHVRTDHGK
jgi:hypothetical protein